MGILWVGRMKRNSKFEKWANEPYYEAEVTPGLEFITEQELLELGVKILYRHNGEIGFSYAGIPSTLLGLRTAQAVYSREQFDVPRPKALLGNTNLPRLLAQFERTRQLTTEHSYATFYLAAAGSESSVMQRIKGEIAQATGLSSTDEKGDLWLRIRPGFDGGWDTLVRLSPRPLVTRGWRVCNFEGALNAATAHAMIRLTQPQADDVFVNLGCGSGTLLIERRSYGRTKLAVGLDYDRVALNCARANLAASGHRDVALQLADITSTPLASRCASALCADLPFGQLSGSHQENLRIYPPMLSEAARIARRQARFVVITHEVKLIESLLAKSSEWQTDRMIRVNLRGLHPRIYVLRRT